VSRRLAVLLLLFATAAAAQQPNLDKGFSADKLYDFLGVDTVNRFNGNLIVSIPLGQEYRSNGILPYRFTLTYNSSVWDYIWSPDGDDLAAVPSRRSNAGIGWLLTLGTLLPPGGDPEAVNNPGNDSNTSWNYISSDGGQHLFGGLLHSSDTGDGIHWYTRDGLYLRMTRVDDTWRTVEFPNGTRSIFRRYEPASSGTWPQSALGTKWRLYQIEDPFGNHVTLTYETQPLYPEIWRVDDGSRQHSVYFAAGSTPYALALHHVTLDTFADTSATYTMTYQNATTFNVTAAGDTFVTTRVAPTLISIGLPDDTYYGMTKDDDTPAYGRAGSNEMPGALTRLKLPTLGSISWVHDPFDEREGWTRPHAASPTPIPPAVATRTLSGPGTVISGTWTYGRLVSNGGQTCTSQGHPFTPARPRQLTTWVNQPDGTSTLAYFSIYATGDPCPAGIWKRADYGLPFTRATASGIGYLSTEVRSVPFEVPPPSGWNGIGGVPGPGDDPSWQSSPDPLWRTEYVSYLYDADTTTPDKNAVPQYFKTIFGTANSCPGCSCAGCFKETTLSSFDDFGHFRQSVTNSDVPGTPYRTTFINHRGSLDAQGHWVLNVPTEACVADEATLRNTVLADCAALTGGATTKFDYDRATGALLGRRVLAGENAANAITNHDLLALFTYTGGNLTGQKFYGGDERTLANVSSTNLFSPTTGLEYEIKHVLTHDTNGTLTNRKSFYRDVDTSTDLTATIEDVDYDGNTGKVKASRDSAGASTEYSYDTSGRLTAVTPPAGLAGTTVTYTAAAQSGATFTAPTATVTTASATSGTVKKTYKYDALGRIWHDKTLMPTVTSQVETLYNAMGQVASVSTRQDASSFSANEKTVMLYDAIGQAKKITAPDLSVTDIARDAAGQIDTTVKNPSGTTAQARTEKYDGLGRLHTVIENAGPTSPAQTSGSQVETTYGYDRGDRLISVGSTAGTQTRSFAYDTRGLLASEAHPESGTTTYDRYDSRGHALHKVGAGGLFDLTFDYDAAERLLSVKNGAASVKGFTYSDASNGTAGKLLTAVRYNTVNGVGQVKVTESYAYAGLGGAVSSKQTEVTVPGSTLQTFTQSYQYDDLSAIKSITYPSCASATPCSVAGGVGTLNRAFTNGFLTGVGSYGSITYHPNGTIEAVTHPGNVTDTNARDDHWLARPKSITFSGYTTISCPTGATVTPETATMCTNATNHATASSGTSYAWTIENGQITSATNLQTIAFTASAPGTVILHVTVSTSGCPNLTAQASVTSTASPSIPALQPADPAPIAPHGTVQLSVTPESNLQYQWYQGIAPDQSSPVPGATSATLNISLTQTTKFWVRATSSCGFANSRTANAVVVVPAPSVMSATTQSNGATVRVTWSVVTDATSYLVEWAETVSESGPWFSAGTSSSTLLDHTPPASATAKAYVYRIRSVDAGNTPSPASSRKDYAVIGTALFSDDPIQKWVTVVRAAHIVELRKAIDAVRVAANLAAVWTNAAAPSGWISQAAINELFAPFNAARPAFGLANFAYGGGISPPQQGGIIISEHTQEVRDALR
jgi:YD repeat-containing protein